MWIPNRGDDATEHARDAQEGVEQQIYRTLCCFGNLPVLQVFGGVTRSSPLQEAHNPRTQFAKQQYNTARGKYLFVVE